MEIISQESGIAEAICLLLDHVKNREIDAALEKENAQSAAADKAMRAKFGLNSA